MKENENIHETVNGGDSSPLLPIESLIHVIRGQQVMLDSDLARLYGVETKRLKEQVKRNINRFPSDFMFELAKNEALSLRSQIATSNKDGVRGGNRYSPFAFTENGVAMLSSVLKSDTAIEVNIINYSCRSIYRNTIENLKRCCRALTIKIPSRLRDFSLKDRYSTHIRLYPI